MNKFIFFLNKSNSAFVLLFILVFSRQIPSTLNFTLKIKAK